MILKSHNLFKLPSLRGGWFSGSDRLDIPYNILILREVLQRDDNGDIEIICQAKDGPEERRGNINFHLDDRLKKDKLFSWLQYQVGKDIETIYESDFSLEDESNIKKCPECGSEMFQSMEPKVANLANTGSKFPNQIRHWRCSNNNCGYKEK